MTREILVHDSRGPEFEFRPFKTRIWDEIEQLISFWNPILCALLRADVELMYFARTYLNRHSRYNALVNQRRRFILPVFVSF